MTILIFGLIAVFFVIYGAGNYYIALRFIQSFSINLGSYARPYWIGVALLALSPFLARLVKRDTISPLLARAALVGDYWLAIFYYFLLLWAVADAFRLVSKVPLTSHFGGAIILIVLALLIYGTWNARSPRVSRHEITINKSVDGLNELRAVMVSDIHLGTTINNDRLAHMVKQINQLNPDIVFFVGDIIDGDISEFAEEQMPRVLADLTPHLGTYAVLGNHEYIGGHTELAVKHLTEAGITVLRDSYVNVAGQFYVVGREDRSGNRMSAKRRLDLSQVMDGIDHELPIILLDHQPSNLREPEENGVDLQLSGHTHYGQFFPNSLVTGRIFEVDWGYLKKESLQVIVSCGFGTWGPPIRIGSYSEIVDIVIRFLPSQLTI